VYKFLSSYAGSQTFTTTTAPSLNTANSDITTADFNGDGGVDYAVVTFSGGNYYYVVYLNNLDGTFTTSHNANFGSFNAYSGDIAAADFDGDGDQDIVVAYGNSSNSCGVFWYANNGSGVFGSANTINLTVSSNCWAATVRAADMDGDGDKDVVTSMYKSTAPSYNVAVALNNGTGTFATSVLYSSPGTPNLPSYALELVDVDADNDMDVVADTGGGNIGIYKNNGSGVLAAAVTSGLVSSITSLTSGDFDGDGDKDIAASVAGTTYLSRNNGTGTYTSWQTISMGGTDIKAADFNGDSRVDLVLSTAGTGEIKIALNKNIATGLFNTPVTYAAGTGTSSDIAVADLNNDSNNDVIIVNTGASATTSAVGLFYGSYTTPYSQEATTSALSVQVATPNVGGLYIKAAANQLADIVDIQNSSGTSLLTVGATGNLTTTGSATIGTGLTVQNGVTNLTSTVASTTALNVTADSATGYAATIANSNTANTADGLLIKLGVANASRATTNYFIGFSDSAGTVAGKIQGGANAVAYTTTLADYAEYFRADPTDLPIAGELVTLDSSRESGVHRATATDVFAGVISTNPGFIGNGPICYANDEDCDANYAKTNVLVALVGQVPLKTNNEGGIINIGDPLGGSSTPGVATKAMNGNIVGYALTTPDANGVVQVLIRPSSVNQSQDLQAGTITADTMELSASALISGNLNVSGSTTLANLTVTGDAQVQGNLVVAGNITTQNITVNGHIITAGDAPVVATGVGAGIEDMINNIAAPVVVIEGNDTSGTVTVTVGKDTAADELAQITFSQAFGGKPRVVLTPGNRDAVKLNAYYDASNASATGFRIMSDIAPEVGKTYVFTYYIVE
jgi:hypothetical protein